MKNLWTKSLFYVGAFSACGLMALTTGCASGGFKLTRQYAGWVNSQNLILRIVLYILTVVVFAVTLLIDGVIFNTIDFWEGKVSAGDFQFKDHEKTYQVHHEFLPGSNLKRSTIQVIGTNNLHLQEIILSETLKGEIELRIDGKVRANVRDIQSIPVASLFNEEGKLVERKTLWLVNPILTGAVTER